MNRTRLVGIGLTVIFIILVLWRIDLAEMAQALASANYWYVVPAACCTLLGYGVRTSRWGVILRPTKSISFASLFPVLMIGFMANNVLPARIGEFVRAYNLGSREGISKSASLATIVVERLFDGITLVLFVAILALCFRLPGWGTELAIIAAAIFGVAAVALIALIVKRGFAIRVVSVLLRVLPRKLAARGEGITTLFIVGLDALKGAQSLVASIALSVLVWLLEAASYYLIISGFDTGLDGLQRVLAAVFMLVVVNLGIMIPSAPGYVGTFQLFGMWALGAFGVERELALGVAVVSHAMQWILVTGIGLLFFWAHNLSFGRIAGEERT